MVILRVGGRERTHAIMGWEVVVAWRFGEGREEGGKRGEKEREREGGWGGGEGGGEGGERERERERWRWFGEPTHALMVWGLGGGGCLEVLGVEGEEGERVRGGEG